jgi:hypothetical protein
MFPDGVDLAHVRKRLRLLGRRRFSVRPRCGRSARGQKHNGGNADAQATNHAIRWAVRVRV